MSAPVDWNACGICKQRLAEGAPRKPLKGALRYVHSECLERIEAYIEEHDEELPDYDPRTFRK